MRWYWSPAVDALYFYERRTVDSGAEVRIFKPVGNALPVSFYMTSLAEDFETSFGRLDGKAYERTGDMPE